MNDDAQRMLLVFFSHRQVTSQNRRARCKSCFLTLLGFSVPMVIMALLLLGVLSKDLLNMALGPQGTEVLSLYLVSVQAGTQSHSSIEIHHLAFKLMGLYLQVPIARILDSFSVEQQLYLGGGLVLLSFLLLIIARFAFR